MTPLSLHLDLAHRRGVLTHPAGSYTLSDEAFERVAARAAPLLEAAGLRDATALTLSREQLEIERAGERTVLSGDAFVKLPRPSSVLSAAAGEAGLRPDERDAVSERDFWEGLYAHGEDGWELKTAAPPLLRILATAAPTRTVVVGCGRGHEVRALAARGFDVLGIDFAERAVVDARALAAKEGVAARFEQRDLFTLPGNHAPFSLWVEHTCFCAISPERRREYVEVAARSLVSGGELVGLFFDHGQPGGPPFTVDRRELEALFSPHFELVHVERPEDSVAPRRGKELLVRMRRR